MFSFSLGDYSLGDDSLGAYSLGAYSLGAYSLGLRDLPVESHLPVPPEKNRGPNKANVVYGIVVLFNSIYYHLLLDSRI